MLTINLQQDINRLTRSLDDLTRKQVPFATALALTRTAQDVRKAIKDEFPRVFDRPTPWTMNSLFLKPATKKRQEARVWLKDYASKGIPATKYLGPQIFGGARNFKRFEKALQRVGILPPGMIAVPGDAAKLDAYGNMSRGQIIQLLSYFSAHSEVGYLANMSEKRRAALHKRNEGMEYFVLRTKWGKLPPGIYQRTKTQVAGKRGPRMQSGVKPVLIFVKPADYKKRLPFFEVAERTVLMKLDRNFEMALEQAIASAR